MTKTLRKLQIPLRLQFLIIALSLAVTTTVLGLSAYLTDTDTYQGTFRTAAGDELGFKLTGTEYTNETIIPGDSTPLNVTASVDKPNDLYVFLELDIPSDFSIDDLNTIAWHPIEEGSNVYFYGHETSLSSFGKTTGTTASTIFNSITLSPEVTGNQGDDVVITGYAIQADNIPTTSAPKQVFNMLGIAELMEHPSKDLIPEELAQRIHPIIMKTQSAGAGRDACLFAVRSNTACVILGN